jgi:hypothetical protein
MGISKEAKRLYDTEFRQKNSERLRQSSLRYYQKNKERLCAEQLRRYHANRDIILPKMRARMHKKKGYPEATRPMPDNCEKCNRSPRGRFGLSLDHDHTTGKFRGWLCSDCNLGIGKLGDTIEGINAALEYLKRAESKVSGI